MGSVKGVSAKRVVLVVDDEPNIRRILQAAFDKCGWHALTAEDGHQALDVLSQHHVDCLLTDVTMPGMSGYVLQAKVAETYPWLPVVIMTAFGTIPQAVDAIRRGAYEYITKPFDLDSLKKVVAAALEGRGVGQTAPSKQRSGGRVARAFVAESEAMKEILSTVRQVADSRATVLVTGASGTGKEVVARMLHTMSSRAEKPFVAVSCAALPETLLESELFGHEKGAFTGADSAKPGRFELADHGTLFLDEIGDIPLATQIKLLRVLQEREIERLGATKTTKIDVRLVTATNQDLQSLVDLGTFRLDLLYRLQVVEIQLPNLKHRREDIIPLALHFLARFSEENGRALTTVSAEAERELLDYDWPGNVRELENAMERATVMAESEESALQPKHLPPKMHRAA